jgi:hypothetical protein
MLERRIVQFASTFQRGEPAQFRRTHLLKDQPTFGSETLSYAVLDDFQGFLLPLESPHSVGSVGRQVRA